MDVDLLKTFLEVYKTRHFGRAADNLFITQSTVSARIKQLEEIVGARLFDREHKQITLTASGEKLVGHAENIIAMWNRVKLDVASEQTGKIPLNVGAVSSLWDIYMQKWLKEINAQLDRFLISCNVSNAEDIHAQINDGTLDLAMTYEPPPHDKIQVIRQLPIKFILVSSEQNLDCLTAINNDYIYVDWGTPFAITHSQYFNEMKSPKLRLALGRIARDYLVRQGGSGYLPVTMIKRDLEKQRLFKVEGAPVIQRDAYWIVNTDNAEFDSIAGLMSVKN